jgi:hypothetical protein
MKTLRGTYLWLMHRLYDARSKRAHRAYLYLKEKAEKYFLRLDGDRE